MFKSIMVSSFTREHISSYASSLVVCSLIEIEGQATKINLISGTSQAMCGKS